MVYYSRTPGEPVKARKRQLTTPSSMASEFWTSKKGSVVTGHKLLPSFTRIHLAIPFYILVNKHRHMLKHIHHHRHHIKTYGTPCPQFSQSSSSFVPNYSSLSPILQGVIGFSMPLPRGVCVGCGVGGGTAHPSIHFPKHLMSCLEGASPLPRLFSGLIWLLGLSLKASIDTISRWL